MSDLYLSSAHTSSVFDSKYRLITWMKQSQIGKGKKNKKNPKISNLKDEGKNPKRLRNCLNVREMYMLTVH